jgi:hypothetical protein
LKYLILFFSGMLEHAEGERLIGQFALGFTGTMWA